MTTMQKLRIYRDYRLPLQQINDTIFIVLFSYKEKTCFSEDF